MGSQILSQEGHTVITVSDGDQAMQHLEEHTPDLVMVDTRMPGPSGFDICKHIKAQPKFSAVKVVLLAGPLEPFDTAEAESAGPDGVLHKPLDAYTLIDTVNSLLGKVPEVMDPVADGAAAKSKAAAPNAETNDEGPRISALPPGLSRVALPSKPREAAAAAPAAAATAAKATTAGTAVASRPATAVADLSDALSSHLTSVVEQALGTEDAHERQRQRVEAIVREVLEAALPAIIEEVTNRVMASLED